ncbi:MAG TPA: hypothetical protein VLY24_24515 [Bryobacteraceae bacterium]|nr:hypothetical protein [Bryobacteraceae bacterium]
MLRNWMAGALLLAAAGAGVDAQVQYATGQNVAPTFEGWEHNPDGTYSMVFGYLNRNYEEEVDIPIGQDNSITVGGETFGDRGQPTHFYPRRQRFLFRVVVPKDFDPKEKVVWKLTSRGRTDYAKGWLQPEWELSQGVMVENMGGGVPDPENKPPTLSIGPVLAATVANPVTLTASATDDGLPKPYRRAPSNPDRDAQPRRPRGVQIKWIVYRGPGKVIFEPDASPIIHGEPVTLTSKVRFGAPGIYVLRATSNDGQLFTSRDITVTVTAGTLAAEQR